MGNYAETDDFVKASGFILLNANAALKDARDVIGRAGFFKRRKAEKDLSAAMEYCKLLIKPANEQGLEFVKNPTLAEAYCRETLARGHEFCKQAMRTNEPDGPAGKRLLYIVGFLETGIQKFLTKDTSERCFYGESVGL